MFLTCDCGCRLYTRGVSRISARGVLKVRPHTKSGGEGGGGGGGNSLQVRGGGGGAIRFGSDTKSGGGGGGFGTKKILYR